MSLYLAILWKIFTQWRKQGSIDMSFTGHIVPLCCGHLEFVSQLEDLSRSRSPLSPTLLPVSSTPFYHKVKKKLQICKSVQNNNGITQISIHTICITWLNMHHFLIPPFSQSTMRKQRYQMYPCIFIKLFFEAWKRKPFWVKYTLISGLQCKISVPHMNLEQRTYRTGGSRPSF